MSISQGDIINIVTAQLGLNRDRTYGDITVNGSTQLIRDLGFSSVEFVVIFEMIQKLVDERINFIDLIMPDRSTYVDDLSVDQIVNFLRHGQLEQGSGVCSDPYTDKRESITQDDIDLLNLTIHHQEYRSEEVTTTTQLCFLLSAPRSGSTLLRRMLGCHPDIYAPMELHLMAYQDFAQRHQELCGEDLAHLLEGTIVARQELRGMSRAVSQAVDQMYVRDRRPVSQFFIEIDPYIQARVLIDKTPTYAFSLATLRRLVITFPEAKFIHLTRRPNAVIKSMIDSDLGQLIRFMQTSGIPPNRFAEALWCLCEQNIRSALKDVGPRVIPVEYETLVINPEQIMRQLHHFLGIQPSVAIDPYAPSSKPSGEQASSYAGDLKTFLRNFIDPGVASEWERFDSLHWLSGPTHALLQNT